MTSLRSNLTRRCGGFLFAMLSAMKPVLWISANPDMMVLRVQAQGERSWVEFRASLPYHQWAETPSHASMLHDMLEGWHACILHAGDRVALLPWHPDYERVAAFVHMMDRAKFPFYQDGRVVE